MRWAVPLLSLVLLVGAYRARAADTRFVQVRKTVSYLQTSDSIPVIQSVNPYEFRARVDTATAQSVSAVSLKWPPPSNATRTLTNFQSYWEFAQQYATPESLNLANPNGTYAVTLQNASDGKKTDVLTLSADVYPSVVRIANFVAAQTVNPSNDFPVQWDPVASDLVQLRVFQNDQIIFETGSVPGADGTLKGNVTTATIPKNTLRSGAIYRTQVIASRRSTFDTTGYPGVPAWAIYSRLTEFTLRTE